MNKRIDFISIALLIFSSFLFGFNNFIISWFVFVPVLFLVNRISLKSAWIYGGLYGILSSSIYVWWLVTYDFASMLGVWILFFLYCSVLFVLLKIVELYLSKYSFFCQILLLMLYQFVQTLGFAGFNYGVIGYSQYRILSFIQSADVFGVWGVTFILVISSCLIYKLCSERKLSYFSIILVSVQLCLIVSNCIYGAIKINKINARDNKCEKVIVCAIQNNSDPWINGLDAYWKDLSVLKEYTDKALESQKIDIVLWPETAIVPSINKAWYLRKDVKRTEYVENLLEYIESKDNAFVIGNFNVDLQTGKEYNSAFFFESKKNVIPPEPQVYSKIHLVPFAEYFPYEKAFPHFYKFLLNGQNQLWSPGTEYTVFEYKGLKFSTPICFEDTFGNDCKKFYKNGARAFLNMSNDAWSKSKKCRKQHLQMAVFRSVENHIPTVRSTVDGVTCYITSTGKIETKCKIQTEDYLVCKIPVIKE